MRLLKKLKILIKCLNEFIKNYIYNIINQLCLIVRKIELHDKFRVLQ